MLNRCRIVAAWIQRTIAMPADAHQETIFRIEADGTLSGVQNDDGAARLQVGTSETGPRVAVLLSRLGWG